MSMRDILCAGGGAQATGAGILLGLGLLLLAGPVLAAQKYKVTASMVHLGEVVAAPVIIVEEGTAARIDQGESPNFTMGVVVYPLKGDQVQLSMDYTSGSVSATPSVVVPIGEPYQTSTDKLVVNLQVDLFEE